MKAVILVGGLGTRLRPLTIKTPKAMVPVLNKPFLEYVIRRLSRHNVTKTILTLNYLPRPIEDHFGDGGNFGLELIYVMEETALGTAGAVKNSQQYLDETFLVLNGDIFTDLDLTAMMDFHRRKKSKATIALTPVDDPTSYGLIETDAQSRVTRFLEKPTWDQVTTNMINAGTYVLEPEILSYTPAETVSSFERQLFPMLLERDEPMYAYPSPCYWIDIGTPEKYLRLNNDLLSGQSNQYHPKSDNRIIVAGGSEVHPGAQIAGPAVIGSGCKIMERAVIEASVIWNGVEIGPGAVVSESIIADNCQLGAGSISRKAVLGDGVSIAAGYKLEPGSRIQPGNSVC